MANELSWRHTATGETLYATVRSQSRQYWNTGTPDWEALTVANWGNYAVATAETPADSYFYVGNMPSVAVGFYWIDFFERAGGSPAIGDEMVGSWLAYWDGTNLRPYDPHTGDSHAVVSHVDHGNAALRTRGDAAWVTATGFSTFDPATDEVDANVVKINGALTDGTPAVDNRPVLHLGRLLVETNEQSAVQLRTHHSSGVSLSLLATETDGIGIRTSAGAVPFMLSGASGVFYDGSFQPLNPLPLGAITASTFADNAITASTFANNAITADKVAANAIGASQLASNAITVDKIADGAITVDKIADAAITPTKASVALGNVAHGGAAASLVLADYSDFQGAGGADAATIYSYFTDGVRADAFKATGFLTSLGATAPVGWINADAIVASALNGKGDWSTFDHTTHEVTTDSASRTASQADVSGLVEQTDLPTNFAALGINASGHVSRVTLVDTTTTNTDMRGTDAALTTLGATAPAGWIDAAALASSALDGLQGDGLEVSKVVEMLLAFMCGQVTAASAAGVTTYTYQRRDGTTLSFTSVCDETDGTRATTGSLT